MLARRALAESVGTAFLLLAIVGSGIMASRLTPGDPGFQLFVVAAVTGATLAAVILAVGPVSGAHLNPAVSLADRLLGGMGDRELGAYAGAQLLGGTLGVVAANAMFELPVVSVATTARGGWGAWLGEGVATFGLVLVIFGMVRGGAVRLVGLGVGAYIAAGHFFTSSTSFANPVVTVARTLSDTFTGIAPGDVGGFVAAQLVGGVAAVVTVKLLYPRVEDIAGEILVPHGPDAAAGTDPA